MGDSDSDGVRKAVTDLTMSVGRLTGTVEAMVADATAKGARAVQTIRDRVSGARLELHDLDLSSLASVAAFGDAVVHTSVVAAVMFGVGTVIVALLIPAKTATASSEKIAFEPIVPFVAPPAKDPAADREVAELEQLLERPSAEPQKSGARHALRIDAVGLSPAKRRSESSAR